MRCVIYLRVSSESQARGVAGRYADDLDNERYGLPTQESNCRSYAQEQGWQILEDQFYIETQTGGELWERPELTKLREAGSRGEFDVVLVSSLDRLSRDQDHHGLLFSEAEKYGYMIDSATEAIDNSPMGKFVRSSYGMMSELERIKLRDRTSFGRRKRVELGGRMPVLGSRIFGYDFEGDRREYLKVNEQEAFWVKRIFERTAEGESARSIARMLEDHGVRTVRGNLTWHASSISRILDNETYIGNVYAFKCELNTDKRGRGPKRVRKSRDEWFKVDYTPPILIDSALWHQAQVARSNKQKFKPRSRKHQLLLDGLGQAVCGKCGRQMSRTTVPYNGKDYYYYRHPDRSQECPKLTTFSQREVDHVVWQRVMEYAMTPDRIHEQIALLEQSDPTVRDRELVEGRINALKKEHGSQSRSFALVAADLDDMTRGIMVKELRDKAEQIKRLENELRVLEARRASWLARQSDLATLEEAVRNLAPRLTEKTTLEEKRIFMTALGIRVEMYKHQSPMLKIYADPSTEGLQRLLIGTSDDLVTSYSPTCGTVRYDQKNNSGTSVYSRGGFLLAVA